jgi:hypothetical protein
MIGQSLLTPTAQAKDIIQMIFHMKRPPSVQDPSVEELAEQIDWLEKHVDSYGSVVAKRPDVWGQARLTKHRQEYEHQMSQQLNQFDVYLQGAESQSDQSFLANALTLQAVASSSGSSRNRGTSVTNNMQAPASSPTANAAAPSTPPANSQQTQQQNSSQNSSQTPSNNSNNNNAAQAPSFPPTPPLADDSTNFASGFTPPNLTNFALSVANQNGIGIEPTIALDQRSAYLDHLHALRRRNDGDDTSDSPGYGLYLLRIPISVMPGKRTYHGYAAEITLTATPQLSPALLPITFRNLVVNDVVDQLSLPITRIADYLEYCRPPYAMCADGSAKDTASTQMAHQIAHRLMRALHTPGTRLRQARTPIPPTQIPAVFGADELLYIAHEFDESYRGPNVRWNDDGQNKHVMYLDVQRFLQAEVEAAYDLLSRPGAEPLWCSLGVDIPSLAIAIQAGQFDRVCTMRENFYMAIGHPFSQLWAHEAQQEPCDEQVVKALAWAIIVESALLNQQLIKDMHDVAQERGCACTAAEGMRFYLPHPDDVTQAAFTEYVRLRWPIHIFALDPDIQEQNIANDFQRRRELQIALSLGFASGQISANDLLNYARRVETEIQTVDLNETAVGFSYGEDTFGWRFYPRLQAPPIKGNLETFADTIFGPSTRCDLLERKIEPGMRECVALVVMPSFVPYLLLETRANWFRLNAHSGWLPTRHKREMSMVDAMKLSRSIRSMHQMASQLCDSPSYRPGDVRLMMARVHQLDRQLPLQHMTVQVPIENTLGGYQMFNHGVTDLAPELYGWYGAPGILISTTQPAAACQGCQTCTNTNTQQPQTSTVNTAGNSTAGTPSSATPSSSTPSAKTPSTTPPATTVTTQTTTITQLPLMPMMPDCVCSGTTVFLVGNHFSVHDTRVIAGGICVPRASMRLLSRQVMQVTIPWNANTVTIEGSNWVDVHVATPYGVTGHLHIPVVNAAAANTTQSLLGSPVSPLEVQLNPANQQLVVKFKHGADITLEANLANLPPNKITMACVDQSVCDAVEKKYDTVLAVVNYDSNRSAYASLSKGAGESDKWPLEVNSQNLWTAMNNQVFKPQAGVFGALATQYAADPTIVSLKVDLYLRGPNGPDLHVIGQLVLNFEEDKAAAAPGAGSMLRPLPGQSQAWAAVPDEVERRYPPQGPVQSGLRLMPAQPGGLQAPPPGATNASPQRLPPPAHRGYLPYLRPSSQAAAAAPQAPRQHSADARALPSYGPGNVPVRR